MNIIVKRATEEDAADLIEVQNKAFLSDYLLFRGALRHFGI